MSAVRLREAARVLRERAEGAPAWWLDESSGAFDNLTSVSYFDDNLDRTLTINGDDEHPVNAAAVFLRTMHRGVALAVADWLDQLAWSVELDGGNDWDRRSDPERPQWAAEGFAVADAILGGAR